MIVALVDDLMFLSRITQAASAKGLKLIVARSPEQLSAAAGSGARLVLIDLDRPRIPVAEVMAALGGAACEVVGFFSHVHAERGQQALAAGCTRVFPRSAFVHELPGLLDTAAG